MVTEQQVYEVLRECYDPEIPVNIVELGLVYGVNVSGDVVLVTMTLTAPGCHLGGEISRDVEDKLAGLPGCREASVELVWEPPWNPGMMSVEARRRLRLD